MLKRGKFSWSSAKIPVLPPVGTMSSTVTGLPSLPPVNAPCGVLAATSAGRRGAEPETSVPPQTRPRPSRFETSFDGPGVTTTDESMSVEAEVSCIWPALG